MHVRELFVRQVEKRVANEGVAKVWQRGDLQEELREYVLTDTIERNLGQFLGLFVESMRTRGSDQALEAMAVWCSGFFGSGKSHFVKVLGHVLQAFGNSRRVRAKSGDNGPSPRRSRLRPRRATVDRPPRNRYSEGPAAGMPACGA